jgi:hypothetical protein
VVDVTWTTASLHRRMRNWRVAEEVEILSDRLYIMMEQTSEIASTGQDRRNTRGPSRSRPPSTPRWLLKERDRDLLQAAVTVSAWSWDARVMQEGSTDEEAENLQRDMSAACDASNAALHTRLRSTQPLRLLVDRRDRGTSKRMRS